MNTDKTEWRESWAYLLGMQAYAYGFPAIYYTKLRFGMVRQPQGVVNTPLNALFHVPRLSDHNDQYGGSPMRDAIYSIAWLDLREGPVVIYSPDSGTRYVSIQLADFYSDLFGYVGPSVNGGRAQTAMIVGPKWQGDTPAGIDKVLRSPTPCAFLVARVSTPGGDDLEVARALQAKSWVKPLSIWRTGGQVSDTPEVRDVLIPLAAAQPLADFHTMNLAMRENPPPDGDAALMRQFAQVGLGPLAETPLEELDDATRRGLAKALEAGSKLLEKVALTGGNTKQVDGWFYGDKNWGRMAAVSDFLGRASPQAYSGIIEHWVEQCTKLRTFVDAQSHDLIGEHSYTLHFAKDDIPEVKAFWSITLYDERFNMVENPIARYAIGSLTDGLKYGTDGSLTIWLQHKRPAPEAVANWLPTPTGKFNLFLRAYLPSLSVMHQLYAPPRVVKTIAKTDSSNITPPITITTNQKENVMSDQNAINELQRVFQLQQAAFLRDPYPSAAKRIELMNRVPGMLRKYREKILQALDADFSGHSHDQGDLLEILGMFDRAKFNIDHVAKWMKPVAKASNPITQGDSKAYIKYQPKGVIGNMVSWNFPFDIAVGPMLDQLGAGNRVIIKPSDMSPACGEVLRQMCAETFDEDQVTVVNGGLEFARYFPTMPWNHLVYTGSGAVGRQVMTAAAANLVPVTLELGGKCPAVIAPDSVDDERTIATVAGIKVIKRGQMCVTVDYCLVPESQLKSFTEKLESYMKAHFVEGNAVTHACGIVSERHVTRLNKLVDEARTSGAEVIQIGQDLKAGARDMPFYLVVNPSDELALMQQEIFGPILAIKTYRDTADAIAYINKGDRPLGLYVFAKDRGFIDQLTQNTLSGGVAINTIALQAGQPSMGFGGSGASGMGRHHGEEGFKEFSNARGYFERGAGGTIDWIIPPYGAGTRMLIDKVAYAPVAQQAVFALKQLPKNLMAKFR